MANKIDVRAELERAEETLGFVPAIAPHKVDSEASLARIRILQTMQDIMIREVNQTNTVDLTKEMVTNYGKLNAFLIKMIREEKALMNEGV